MSIEEKLDKIIELLEEIKNRPTILADGRMWVPVLSAPKEIYE